MVRLNSGALCGGLAFLDQPAWRAGQIDAAVNFFWQRPIIYRDSPRRRITFPLPE